jgi:hypothetical protein
MATTPTISDVCYQRKQRMAMFNVVPTRFTPISPYPQYKKADLDMRRKAEVLSYGAAKSNTKTNNYTKAEKYALFIKGINQSSSYTSLVVPASTVIYTKGSDFLGTVDSSYTIFTNYIKKATAQDCPNLNMIPTPTSSSGVPGPIQYLYRDLTIPLYNYATNERSYSSEPVTSTDMWVTNEKLMQNIICSGLGIDTLLLTIGILNPIDKPSYNFTVNIPVALTYSATVNYTTTNSVNIPNILLTVAQNPIVKVLYSQNQVQDVKPVCTFSNNSIQYDISFAPIRVGSTTVSITSYIGILTIGNLNLFTSPGFIYDIKLNCLIDKKFPSTSYSITNETYSLVCNYQGSALLQQNCILKQSPINTLTAFTVRGI